MQCESGRLPVGAGAVTHGGFNKPMSAFVGSAFISGVRDETASFT